MLLNDEKKQKLIYYIFYYLFYILDKLTGKKREEKLKDLVEKSNIMAPLTQSLPPQQLLQKPSSRKPSSQQQPPRYESHINMANNLIGHINKFIDTSNLTEYDEKYMFILILQIEEIMIMFYNLGISLDDYNIPQERRNWMLYMIDSMKYRLTDINNSQDFRDVEEWTFPFNDLDSSMKFCQEYYPNKYDYQLNRNECNCPECNGQQNSNSYYDDDY